MKFILSTAEGTPSTFRRFLLLIFPSRPLRFHSGHALPFDPTQGGPSTKAQDGERKWNRGFVEPRLAQRSTLIQNPKSECRNPKRNEGRGSGAEARVEGWSVECVGEKRRTTTSICALYFTRHSTLDTLFDTHLSTLFLTLSTRHTQALRLHRLDVGRDGYDATHRACV